MAIYFPPTTNGLQKTLGAALDQGVTASATLNNVTGIQAKRGVFVVNRIDTNGNELDASLREYIAYTTTSGSTVITLTRGLGGTSDQDHAIGSVVEFMPDVTWAQGITDALLETVDEDGSLDASKVVDLTTAQTLTNKTLTAPVISSEDNAAPTDAGQIKFDSVANTLKYGNGSTTIEIGSSAVTDSGGYIKPTTDGDDIRVYDGAGTDYVEVSHDGTDSKITSGVGHIVLTPATNKLVKVAVYRDNNGTAAYTNNSVILTGWGFQNGNGAANPFIQETVTFGITFAAAPIVLISSVGRTAAGAASLNASWADYISHAASNIDTTSFRANTFRTPGATNLSNFDYVYTWIAIGELS